MLELPGFGRLCPSRRAPVRLYILVLFHAARQSRSEETMRSNIFGNMILGTIFNGQGSTNAVAGTHRTTLRRMVALYCRGLALRLGSWRALVLKRVPAAMPAVAACPTSSARRRQHQRCWMPGVVDGVAVDRGPVGVC
jgi:hypothetical protein